MPATSDPGVIQITIDDVKRMFPRGQKTWLEALVRLQADLLVAGEITTCGRWCHFVTQVAAETDGLALARMRENMNYRPKRILEVFDYRVRKAQREHARFRGSSLADIAAALAASPDLLAETVYGGRRDIGNISPGDGSKFIGRGPLQTTGRGWYEKLSKALGVDLVEEPHRLEDPETGWRAAFVEWRLLGCNAIADSDSVERVSRRVNGGTNGLARRKSEYVRACSIWPDGEDPIGAPSTPRLADAPPAATTPQTLIEDGSRSMTWLQRGKVWLGTSGISVASFFGLDTLGAFRGTLNELKELVADHAMVLVLVAVGTCLAVILLAQHYLAEAARDGRYVARKG